VVYVTGAARWQWSHRVLLIPQVGLMRHCILVRRGVVGGVRRGEASRRVLLNVPGAERGGKAGSPRL